MTPIRASSRSARPAAGRHRAAAPLPLAAPRPAGAERARRRRRRRRRQRRASARAPTTTTITQSSQRAAINWQSFDVGAQQSVQFNQPSASAVALNRVVGPNPSQIAGHIDANGQIILVNQDGRHLLSRRAGQRRRLRGLRRRHVRTQDFMAGRMAFDAAGASRRAHRQCRHASPSSRRGWPRWWRRRWPIPASSPRSFGHVVLAGAQTATLDLYGDGLVALDVTNQVTQAPGGADGAGDQHRHHPGRRAAPCN